MVISALTAGGILLDTSIFIAAEKNVFDLGAFVRQEPAMPHAMSAVTAAELLVGVERANTDARKRKRSEFVEKAFSNFDVLDFTLPCARRCASIAAWLQDRGIPIGSADLQIAATALHYGYTLATFTADEFRRVPDLQVHVPVPFAD